MHAREFVEGVTEVAIRATESFSSYGMFEGQSKQKRVIGLVIFERGDAGIDPEIRFRPIHRDESIA